MNKSEGKRIFIEAIIEKLQLEIDSYKEGTKKPNYGYDAIFFIDMYWSIIESLETALEHEE